MPLDKTPGQIIVKTRDEVLADFLRDYRVRQKNADTTDGGQPYIDGSVVADQVMPLYANAQIAGRASTAQTAIGQPLRNHCEPIIGPPLPATSAFGSFMVTTSVGGSQVIAGDELVDDKTGLKFQAIDSLSVLNNQQISIASKSTGPATNLGGGTTLRWTSPRPGMGATGTIVTQSDGTGLSGGRIAESDDDYRARFFAEQSDPAAEDNDAELRRIVFKTPNMSIKAVFTFPAVFGPGTTAIAFLLPPTAPGASRAPNPTEMAVVQERVAALSPGDDSYFVATATPQPTTLVYRATWRLSASGWVDSPAWPAYNATDKVKVDGAVARTSTSFRLTTTQTQATPQVGQTIAFLDLTLDTTGKPKATMRNKRILTVAVVVAGKSWDIVCDTTNGASDTSYVPSVGQLASPWSPSLDDVVGASLAFFDALGVGEMVSSLPDPGRRQRRQPVDPEQWPSALTNVIINPVQALPSVSSATLLDPTTPLKPSVGTPGTQVYFLSVGDIAVFAT